ncbi:helix-turn-helix domain-containing protein [Streptomyces malaysiensis]|uniref:helix-turn-helix domain-containing protein n=1 Tax=Streptomyces malaysiensis TaxID=92644 RepID=UPI00142ED082|nr:helix-turn-helix domain-containing protein [Streptomyces malaysiensis]
MALPLTEEQRAALIDDVKKWYEQDEDSIRTIANRVGRSYGLIYRLLDEGGVKRRTRGGRGGCRHLSP